MSTGSTWKRSLTVFAVFQVIWFASVVGAGRGYPWLGPASLVLLAFPLLLAPDRARELRLWLLVGVLGSVVDSGLYAAGWIDFHLASEAWPGWLVPLWISGLWIAFASMLRTSLLWLRGRVWLAMAFGFVGGPLSFQAGSGFGAVAIPEPRWHGLLALALEWAVLTPLLIEGASRSSGASADPQEGT